MDDWVTQAGGGDNDDKRTWKVINALPARPTQRTVRAHDELGKYARGVILSGARHSLGVVDNHSHVILAADADLGAFHGDDSTAAEAQLCSYEEAWSSLHQQLQVGFMDQGLVCC